MGGGGLSAELKYDPAVRSHSATTVTMRLTKRPYTRVTAFPFRVRRPPVPSPGCEIVSCYGIARRNARQPTRTDAVLTKRYTRRSARGVYRRVTQKRRSLDTLPFLFATRMINLAPPPLRRTPRLALGVSLQRAQSAAKIVDPRDWMERPI